MSILLFEMKESLKLNNQRVAIAKLFDLFPKPNQMLTSVDHRIHLHPSTVTNQQKLFEYFQFNFVNSFLCRFVSSEM